MPRTKKRKAKKTSIKENPNKKLQMAP